jgi:hypothetical protein
MSNSAAGRSAVVADVCTRGFRRARGPGEACRARKPGFGFYSDHRSRGRMSSLIQRFQGLERMVCIVAMMVVAMLRYLVVVVIVGRICGRCRLFLLGIDWVDGQNMSSGVVMRVERERMCLWGMLMYLLVDGIVFAPLH